MDELESIRKRKLDQLRRMQEQQVNSQIAQDVQAQQQLSQLEAIVRQKFTRKALERYGNVKVAHPEKAARLVLILAQAIQQGNIPTIDDNILRQVLMRMAPPKKETKINKI